MEASPIRQYPEKPKVQGASLYRPADAWLTKARYVRMFLGEHLRRVFIIWGGEGPPGGALPEWGGDRRAQEEEERQAAAEGKSTFVHVVSGRSLEDQPQVSKFDRHEKHKVTHVKSKSNRYSHIFAHKKLKQSAYIDITTSWATSCTVVIVTLAWAA